VGDLAPPITPLRRCKMQSVKITILLGLLLLATTACQSQEQELPFESIAQRDIINYREESPHLFIVANDEDIGTLSRNVLAEDPTLAEQLSQLDYDLTFAVLVLQGQKGSTGYTVNIKQVVRQGNRVTIKAEFVEPSPGAFIKPAFTSPYHLVAVSKEGQWGQEVTFVLVVNDESVAETTHFIP
ncbi:MAG: protease complex subunit PrcB family protein, partial [Chloroflexus sp.]|uniref:protease complex subunit PrcB family protein n=1 Tax=Chloroflexus sp. TaxID=1904827 RepID=UPI00404B0B2A